jgi:putative transposase
MKNGFLYLTAIIDVYSRYIVGWGISNTLDADASLSVLKQAIKDHGKPEIINSDQGSQFTCEQWVDYLKEEDIRISMDGKGRAVDNIFIERFFRSLKYDYVYLHPANDGVALYQGVKEYIQYYNHTRHHQGIGRKIPATLYQPAA